MIQIHGGSKSQLSSKELAKLLPLLPPVLLWMRERDLEGSAEGLKQASLRLQRKEVTVDQALEKLASAIDVGPLAKARKRRMKSTSVFPSTKDLKILFLSVDLQVWYVCVLRIFAYGRPSAIPADINMLAKDLLGFANAGPNGSPKPLVITDIRKTLPNLVQWLENNVAISAFYAFGELCSLLRDSMSLSGQSKLLPLVAKDISKVVLQGNSANSAEQIRCCQVLETCILHCYDIFYFLPEKNNNWNVMGNRALVLPKDIQLKIDKLKTDLTIFYELKDTQFAKIVPKLFEAYKIEQIALGILIKYKCLPVGWKKELLTLKKTGNSDLDWFDPKKITFVSESTTSRSVKATVSVTNYVPSGAKKKYLSYKKKADADEVNLVIDELIERKFEYFDALDQFLNDYVSEIHFIAKSQSMSTEAKTCLGIGEEQIEQIMGSKLRKIVKLERDLCSDLEVLALLPCPVQQNYQRIGVLCKIMDSFAERMREVYAEYSADFEANSQLLTVLIQNCNNNLTSRSTKRNMTFLAILQEVSHNNRNLSKSLDSILQMPVSYIPKLPLYFKRVRDVLEKRGNTTSPSYTFVIDTYSLLTKMLGGINQSMAELNNSSIGKVSSRAPGSSYNLSLSIVGTPLLSPISKIVRNRNRTPGSFNANSSVFMNSYHQ